MRPPTTCAKAPLLFGSAQIPRRPSRSCASLSCICADVSCISFCAFAATSRGAVPAALTCATCSRFACSAFSVSLSLACPAFLLLSPCSCTLAETPCATSPWPAPALMRPFLRPRLHHPLLTLCPPALGQLAVPPDSPPSQKARDFGWAKHPGVAYSTLPPLLRVRMDCAAKLRPVRPVRPELCAGGLLPRERATRDD